MNWDPPGEPLTDFAFLGSLAPEDVLYELEGPRLFTTRDFRGSPLLAYVCDEGATGIRVILAPTSQEIVSGLEGGTVTLAEALNQPWLWLASVNQSGEVLAAYRTCFDDIPAAHRPRPGVGLVFKGRDVKLLK